MNAYTQGTIFCDILVKGEPAAIAEIKGNADYPKLSGTVKFFDTPYDGILVEAEIYGLPNRQENGGSQFYAMHIHEKGDCSGAFENTGAHYSKTAMPHPFHSGDLVPLLGNQGYAWTAFYDRRIMVSEIIGRSVIIHENADDFTTQPSGNAGKKIGCGVFESCYR